MIHAERAWGKLTDDVKKTRPQVGQNRKAPLELIINESKNIISDY